MVRSESGSDNATIPVSSNARRPIQVSVLGKAISASAWQLKKALFSMTSTAEPSVTEARAPEFMKAPSLMTVTESGITTANRLEHAEKTSFPSVTRESGSDTDTTAGEPAVHEATHMNRLNDHQDQSDQYSNHAIYFKVSIQRT
jgi:hypothetical protein